MRIYHVFLFEIYFRLIGLLFSYAKQTQPAVLQMPIKREIR